MARSPQSSETRWRDLFLLRDDLIYLNHGSFGACPRPVFAAYQRWQRELERNPAEFLAFERRFRPLLAEARTRLAAFLNAAADDLVFVPNATTGLNTVARSLDLGPGDEVLTTDHEYGALDRTWQLICRKRGAQYVRQSLPLPVGTQAEFTEALMAGVTSRTRVLFFSHVTSPTAVVFPVADWVVRARELGILTVVDGAHGPGQVDLDLPAVGADFYVGNCHKWLMAPKGSAFLYARREVQPLLEPLVVSWGFESEDPGPSRFVDEQEYTGTRDIAAYLAVPEALRFFEQPTWAERRLACHDLAGWARREITAMTGLAPLTPDEDSWFGQMATVRLPICDPLAVARRLREEHRVEVPVFFWNDAPYLRFSVQGYNTAEEIQVFLAALREVF